MYEVEDFHPNGPDARLAVYLLDTLEQISDAGEERIRTRWGIVDLGITLIRLQAEDFHVSPAKIREFFDSFELERRGVSQTLSDLQAEVVELSIDDEDYSAEEVEFPKIPRDMFEYFIAFSREGATKENIEIRATIMYQRIRGFLKSGKDGG